MPNGIVEMCIDAKTMAAVQTPALMGKGLKLSRLQLPCPPPPRHVHHLPSYMRRRGWSRHCLSVSTCR